MLPTGWPLSLTIRQRTSLKVMSVISRTPKRKLLALGLLAPVLLALLAACTPTVPLTPAGDATNPKCAEIIVRLPESVVTQPIRQTNAQATAAWGDPTSVLLRCGVAQPAPSASCSTVNGIDWVVDVSGSPRYVYTTYGRSPATQVVVDTKLTQGQEAIILDALGNAVGSIPQTKFCTLVSCRRAHRRRSSLRNASANRSPRITPAVCATAARDPCVFGCRHAPWHKLQELCNTTPRRTRRW
jgi:hypothetical protein